MTTTKNKKQSSSNKKKTSNTKPSSTKKNLAKTSEVVTHKDNQLDEKPVEENPKISGYYSIILFLLFVMSDRITKIWALTLSEPIDLGILEFVFATNTGAGFSILQNQNTLLSWIAVIALGIMMYYHEHFPRLGFVMIIAGIIGNLIDRFMYGYVIDFINFKIWPIFNIADSLVFIGVILTVIYWYKKDKAEKRIVKKNKKSVNRKKKQKQ